MQQAKIILDRDFVIGEVDRYLYGSFIEHLGRAVYSGIYEPGHPDADEQGFRKDVLQLVKDLGVTIVRYPGGNFASGYNWTDGIGPRDRRPRRLELAWRSIETNEVGIDEFVDWARKAGVDVMAAVNLGTGTPQEAGYFIEYCNHPSGTYWSDLRIEYGHKDPHSIKVWCLGNEMDGPWQICHLEADDYGKKALETAKIMKWVDPEIKLVASGSSTSFMPTFPEWDRTILEYLYDHVEYISLHRYYENEGDVDDFLASFVDMDRFIRAVVATADFVKAKKRSAKSLMLSFDEWNVWYQKKLKLMPWETAPPILEDRYSLLDALVVGGLISTLINNADRVKMACLAQLVNVIAPIYTERGGRAIKQTIYHPFRLAARYGRGEALKPIVKAPTYGTRSYEEVPLVYPAATYDEASGDITVFVLNTSQDVPVKVELDFRSFDGVSFAEHIVLDGPDLHAINTFEEPDKVHPRREKRVEPMKTDVFSVTLPRLSWNVLRFRRNRDE
ncbi:alpha-L-arabinofuranosidase domain protein [Spirochaeta thermophila DSM 6578]|uniref:non-reducing end alpha-L-arabinofuranosidase n=1 Tax=Winmispira thermophila (strain ATCC 700085 / DSM 6578 / Z-1203) TaxID=869211 RepID=G0GAR0_WINT7|nr:alpha-N-arabinofuranosidase [Spirochaeta thermophila]AEJ61025.1 alpha-L-arabinofuranosidase domain protein [Spirochaeta thermophila DSM 6578]